MVALSQHYLLKPLSTHITIVELFYRERIETNLQSIYSKQVLVFFRRTILVKNRLFNLRNDFHSNDQQNPESIHFSSVDSQPEPRGSYRVCPCGRH